MKTEKVIIKDFKVIKNLEKEVNGNHIILMGDNGVGKSSFIQFIKIALGDQSNIPASATGEGEVIVSKDGKPYKFQVKFKDGKPVVTVTGSDGIKDNRKGTIASIVGAMEFNIDKFVELSKTEKGRKEQVEIFKSFLPEEVRNELSKYEMDSKIAFEERTDINRQAKEKHAVITSHRLYNIIDIEKFEEVDVKEKLADLKKAQEHNAEFDKKEKAIEDLKKRVSDGAKYILELQAKIEVAKKEIEKIESEIETENEWMAFNPKNEKLVAELEETINSANDKNSDFKDSVSLKKDIEIHKQLTIESEKLTKKLTDNKQLIEDTIKDMDSPVKGLSFDENDRLVYNGVPVSPDNLSTSEIIELGIRLKMAENPELGILFIEHGESIGEERLKTIMDIANQNNWQVIMEQVERGKKELQIEIVTP